MNLEQNVSKRKLRTNPEIHEIVFSTTRFIDDLLEHSLHELEKNPNLDQRIDSDLINLVWNVS